MESGEQIALAIGVVVAAGLALQTALGPAMYAIVEAVKATGRIPDGWGGVASILIGIVLGLITGLIAWHQDGDFWWLAVGAFAGLLLGVGGVSEHQTQTGIIASRNKKTTGTASSSNAISADSEVDSS